MNESIKQYEWLKQLNDRQVNELIGLIDDWLIIDTEPIDSNVWLDRERWTNIDFVMIFVSGTVSTYLHFNLTMFSTYYFNIILGHNRSHMSRLYTQDFLKVEDR